MVEPHLPAEASYRDWDCVDDAHALLSVNALRLQGDQFAPPARTGLACGRGSFGRLWSDGGAILRMRGGGGAARSVAHAWVNAGGRVHPLRAPSSGASLARTASAGSRSRRRLGSISTVRAKASDASKHLIPAYQNKAVQRTDPSMDHSSTGVGCWSPSTSKHGASSGHRTPSHAAVHP